MEDRMQPQNTPAQRQCPKCGVVKQLSEFHRNARNPDGHTSYCKPCACANTREWNVKNPARKSAADARWKAANPERRRATDRGSHLRIKYGLTMAEGDALIARGCDVCGSMKDPRINHDHETGAVRGVLCHRHNVLEGMLAKARAEGVLDALVAYVQNPPGKGQR